MRLCEKIPLAPLTTLEVGGAARYFVEAGTAEEVSEAVSWARTRNLPLFVLGSGSNVVVADNGFPGLVLRVAIRGLSELGNGAFTVGAGEDWDKFVASTVARNCAGLECLSGIPGTAGAAPVQNVGAYGQEVAETLRSIRALDCSTGTIRVFSNADCGFGYRTSIFNRSEHGRYIILHTTHVLTPGGVPRITYAELQHHFGMSTPTLAATREAVLRIRRQKGMLLVGGDAECRSAGSFFKNPVLTPQVYAGLQQRASARGLSLPSYPALASQYKVPAAWLVEQAGFPKGYTRGTVGISHKHALALVNRGGATAAEVIAFQHDIQRAVCDQFGIQLDPEPVFVGFEHR